MPPLPDQHALAVLLLTVVALFLFTRERVPLETSSLVVLVLLTLGFEWFPYHDGTQTLHTVDFFSGFGHEALVAVCGLMIVGHGLVRTGALEPIGRMLARLWSHSPQLSLLLTLILAGLLSAFVNNTPVVVLLLPILVSVSLRTGTSASGILMPMGLSTLVGGMATTIGTSTNLLVVSVAADLGLRRFGMFDFFVPAVTGRQPRCALPVAGCTTHHAGTPDCADRYLAAHLLRPTQNHRRELRRRPHICGAAQENRQRNAGAAHPAR